MSPTTHEATAFEGSEQSGQDRVMPPFVYVPTITGPDGEQHVALRRLLDGRVALLVYTAFDRMQACVGDSAWAMYDWDGLERLRSLSWYDVLIPDMYVPQECRNADGWELAAAGLTR